MSPGNANCMPMKWKFHKHAIRIPCLWNRICISISFSEEKKRDNKYSAGRHGSPSPSEIEADMPEIPRKNCIFVPSRKLKKETLYNYEGFSAYSPALCAPL